MVLDLKIQTTEQPASNSIPTREIDRSFDLVNGPWNIHTAELVTRKVRLFDAMGELEHYG
jgi:hypothetical protein